MYDQFMTNELEYARRLELWDQVQQEQSRDPDQLVEAKFLREIGVYKAGSGIDRALNNGNHTTHALSVVHTGTSYDDDWSTDGVLYHFPKTNRSGSTDQNEIESLRSLLQSKLFLFAIKHEGNKRRVVQGWVKKAVEHAVWIAFSESDNQIDQLYEMPFEQAGEQERKRVTRQVKQYVRDPKFVTNVFDYYGSSCIMTGVSVPEVVDAAHIRGVAKGGVDHHQNGIPLAAHVHRAFDANIIGICPETYEIQDKAGGDVLKDLRIDPHAIQNSDRKPHDEVIVWRWKQFKGG